jgi:hypothetical protein
MLHKFKLILQFYKGFYVIGLILNVLFAKSVFENGIIVLEILIPGKILINFFIAFFVNYGKRFEFNYYNNLGVRKKQILWVIAGIDFAVFLLLSLFAEMIRK